MSILLDLLGALIIASLLMLMMISFQFQLQNLADRTMFSAQMLAHEQKACTELNRVIALVGVGVAPDSMVTEATATSATFRTRWSYTTGSLMLAPSTLQLTLSAETSFGKQLSLTQGGTVVKDLGYILWIEDLSFRYYDINDAEVTIPTTTESVKTIRSMDVRATFKRNAPRVKETPLRTRMQMRIYFMNAYLQGG